MSRTDSIIRTVAVMVAIAVAPIVRADERRPLFDIPADSIAWWAFDPEGFAGPDANDPQKYFVQGVLRAALAGGLIEDDEAAAVVGGALGASVVMGVPHRACVFEFEASPDPDTGKTKIDELQMAIELRTGRDHGALLGAVKSLAVDAGAVGAEGNGNGSQRRFTLANGIEAAAYRRGEWPVWREVSWCSTPEAFVVGIGPGSLERWFESKGSREAGVWAQHRESVDERRPDGRVFFEGFVDLNAIRAGRPDGFSGGRTGKALEALRLANGRGAMLHARWIEPGVAGLPEGAPPMIAMDASWEPRSHGADQVRSEALSEHAWPGELVMSPPPGSYIIVARAKWGEWINMILDVYRATIGDDWDLLTFDSQRDQFDRKSGARVKRLEKSFKPWVVFSDVPSPPIPVPGLTTIFLEIDGVRPQRVEQDLSQTIGSATKRIERDDKSGVWGLRVIPKRIDPGGLMRVMAWDVIETDPPVVVFGWSPSVVESNRKRMSGRASD